MAKKNDHGPAAGDQMKRAEHGPQDSLARAVLGLEVALEGAEAAPWQYNLKTGGVEWSPRGYFQIGVPQGAVEPSLDAFLDFTHPDDRERLIAIRAEEQAAPEGSRFIIQLRLRGADGRIRWVERRSVVGPDEPHGRRIFGVDLDITQRKAVEQRLRESEERYRELSDFMPQIVWQADATGIIEYVNNRWTELTGRPVSEAIGKPWLPGMVPEDMERALKAWDAAQSPGAVYEHEWRLTLPDGSLHWLMTRGRAIRDSAGNVLRWIGTDTDITTHKQALARLRESEARLGESTDRMRLALDAGALGDWTWNASTDELDVSPRVYELFGQPQNSRLTWSKLLTFLHPEDAVRASRAVDEAMTSGEDYAVEYRVNKPGGRQSWIASRGRLIHSADGSPAGMIGVFQDISERKGFEQHLKLLINELNHRVKNTLATVQSMAGLTLRTSPTLEEAGARFDARLIALAGAHDVLTRENWEGADLQEIVGKAIAPYRSKEHDRFFVEGPDIALTPRFALALAMALHELGTNAAKYGALSESKGRVDIVWAVAGQKGARVLCLDWREHDGPKVSRPTRRGFGSRLIEQSVAQDLGGRVDIDYAEDGVVCTIRAPLEPKSAIPDLEGHGAQAPAHR